MGQLLYAGGAQKEPSGAGSRDNWEKNSSEGNILTQQRKVSFANALVIENKNTKHTPTQTKTNHQQQKTPNKPTQHKNPTPWTTAERRGF